MDATMLPTLLAPAPAGPTAWMPQAASTVAPEVDGAFYFILYVSAAFFIGIMATMIFFVIRYRRRSDDQKTSPSEGNLKLEIAWAVLPSIILVAMFVWGFRTFLEMSIPPEGAMEVRVTGRKWSWSFSYPGQGVGDVPEMAVPLGKPVKVVMSSDDVIHSFYIPAFRLKRDVLPNRFTVLWFEATRLGDYDIFCTEYCGTGHSRMHARVRVLKEADFKAWVKKNGATGKLPPLALGKHLFTAKGCVACHSTSADRQSKPGPALGGRWGKTRPLAGGGSVTFDDAYVRESVYEPKAKVAQGFAPIMPTFKGRLNEQELNGLITYLKSLSK